MTTSPGAKLPRRIGRYEVVAPLAAGGMAEALLARLVGPSGFERVVVLKRMLPHLAREPRFVTMFLDEARLAARIHHANVAQVNELGEIDGEFFLAMEYVQGESLGSLMKELCVRQESLPLALCAYVIAEACAGLHAAHSLTDADGHSLDVVHRDVSPQNVIVTYAGGVKVLDFGIARAGDRLAETEAGQVKGKYGYMSPEQCRGKTVDCRSDIFALGTLLYELSTGRRLFKRDSEMEVLQAICEAAVVPPSQLVTGYAPEVEAICLRALAAAREQRYATAADMRRDLLRAVRKLGQHDDPAETLSAEMHRLFADRIEEKREMLRRVSAGTPLSILPPSELHGDVEIPTLPLDAFGETRATMQTDMVAPARKEWRYVIAAVLIAALAIVAFAMRPAPVQLRVAGSLAPSVAPSSTSSSASAEREVVLRIVTRPPGARVYVKGDDRGLTPLELRVAQGSAIELRITRDGFVTVVRDVVPKNDERLDIALVPRPARASASAPDENLEFRSVD